MINTLTSLRFFFALAVFAHHIILNVNRFINLPGDVSRILDEGFIGVGFFFILSGFVLTYSYQNKILTNTTNKKDFYIARFARIYPMHLFMLLFVLLKNYVLFTPETPFNIGTFFINLFLLQSFVPETSIYFSFNDVSWSLSDEMFFYLCFPFLIPLLSKLKVNIKFLSVLIMAVIVFIVNLQLNTPEEKFAILYINPFMRIFDFILGIYICKTWLHLKDKVIKLNFNLLEIGSVVILFAFVYLSVYFPLSYRYSIYYWIPIAILLVTFAFQKGIISKVISKRIFVLLGEASFCFYMIHVQWIQSMKTFMFSLKDWLPADNPLVSMSVFAGVFILTFAGICLLSIALHLCIEKPMNKYIKKVCIKPKLKNVSPPCE